MAATDLSACLYKIVSVANDNYVLHYSSDKSVEKSDIVTKQADANEEKKSQGWSLQWTDTNKATLKSNASAFPGFIGVPNPDDIKEGTLLKGADEGLQFYVNATDTGYILALVKKPELVLTVKNPKPDNNIPITVDKNALDKHQQWKFVKLSD